MDFEIQWVTFNKTAEKQRWIQRLRTFFDCQLKYDWHVAERKRGLRLRIRQLFANNGGRYWTSDNKKKKFDEMFGDVLKNAEKEYPSVSVEECIQTVYTTDSRIGAIHGEMLDEATIAKVNNDVRKLISGVST